MNSLAFIASLVHSLAWPAGVVATVAVLRRPIGAAFHRGDVRRFKAGLNGVELEMFDHTLVEVRAEVSQIPELRDAPELANIPAPRGDLPELLDTPGVAGLSASTLSLSEELAGLAVMSPRAAVLEAYERIETRLGDILAAADVPTARTTMHGKALAVAAHRYALISDEAMAAVDGLAKLRNLAAHGHADEPITVDRAVAYLKLADAVMFALRPKGDD